MFIFSSKYIFIKINTHACIYRQAGPSKCTQIFWNTTQYRIFITIKLIKTKETLKPKPATTNKICLQAAETTFRNAMWVFVYVFTFRNTVCFNVREDVCLCVFQRTWRLFVMCVSHSGAGQTMTTREEDKSKRPTVPWSTTVPSQGRTG